MLTILYRFFITCCIVFCVSPIYTKQLPLERHLDSLVQVCTPTYLEEYPLEVEERINTLLNRHSNRTFSQDSTIAEVLHLLGSIHYNYYDKPTAAIRLTEKSMSIRQQIFPPTHFEITRSLFNLGLFYKYLGRYSEAFKYILQTQEIYKKHHPEKTKYIAKTYLELAELYDRQSDYEASIKHYDLALSLFEKINEKEFILDCQLNKAVALSEYKQSEAAIQLLQKMLSELDEDYSFFKPDIYANLGDILEESDGEQAIKMYDKANYYYKEMGEDYIYNMIVVFQNQALVETKLGRLQEAEQHLKIAHRLCKQAYESKPYHYEYASIYDKYGDFYFKQKEYRTALEYYHSAIMNCTINFRDTSIYSYPNFDDEIVLGAKTDLLIYLSSKAKTFIAWYQTNGQQRFLEEALKIYQLLDKLIDTIRFEHHEEDSKLYWRKATHPIYEQAIKTALALGNEEMAFNFSEKSKSVLLLDVIRDAQAHKNAGLPDSIALYIKEQQSIIYEKELELEYNEDIQLKTNVLDSKQALYSYIQRLEERYPEYYQYKYNAKVLPISFIQEKLHKHQVILEYFVTDTILYCFTILKDGFQTYQLPFDKTLKKEILQFRKLISDLDYITKNPQKTYDSYVNVAYSIYNKIIPLHLKDALNNYPYELLIIPDGSLNYFPFEALLTKSSEPSKSKEYNHLPYLLHRATTRYSYTASLAFQLRKKQKALNPHLGIAPNYKQTLENSKQNTDQLRNNLGELTANVEEVNHSRRLFGGEIWEGDNAKENSFKNSAQQYQVLHLAMHAFMDDNDPAQSKLIFTDSDDSLEDDYLHVYELYSMKLNADLVVLSACNTGGGQYVQGEGVMSLARAFIYAGCSSIIMSMSKAEDRATGKLMQLFFEHAQDGLPKSIALNQAKQQYLTQHSGISAHPFFWSNFVLVGEDKPLEFQHFSYWYLFGGLTLMILIFFFIKKGKTLL